MWIQPDFLGFSYKIIVQSCCERSNCGTHSDNTHLFFRCNCLITRVLDFYGSLIGHQKSTQRSPCCIFAVEIGFVICDLWFVICDVENNFLSCFHRADGCIFAAGMVWGLRLLKLRKQDSARFVKNCLWSEEVPPAPVVAGGMTGVAADEKKGKKKGGGEKVSGNGEPSPAALLFPFCPYRRSVIPPKPLGEAEPPSR